ncbi:MAG TPA: aquaporin [Bacteroidia bacterium]|jgi:aquaporin NIP|nr:aquaporin [Bacteroidia bacterium]
MKKGIAELIGTFALVFCGTGAIVMDQASGGAVTHAGVAITFGLIVLAMIYALGDISGAHLNPAVTIAFTIANRLSRTEAVTYILFQLAGAFLASLTLKFMFPHIQNLGVTMPAGSDMQSFVLETILTFFLMFVIMNVSTGAKEKGITAGIAVASVVGLEAMFAGPICGASMNPARSIAPAVVSGNLDCLSHQWIYIAAPILGAVIAVFVFNCIKPNQQKS